MKKFFLVTLFVIFTSLTIPFVRPLVRADHESGKPFEEIWQAIRALQQQIVNIELVPGPQGPTGLQGPEGPQGPPGSSGGGDSQLLLFTRPGPWVTILAMADALAECEMGETLIGGGYEVTGGGVFITNAKIVIIGHPAWMVTGSITSGTSRDIRAIAHCAKIL